VLRERIAFCSKDDTLLQSLLVLLENAMKQQMSYARRAVLLVVSLGLAIAVTQIHADDKAQMEGRLMSGEKFNLTQWKGKVVMLNFWATWCGVCKSEMPGWQQYYESNKDKGFQMLAVSVDDGEAEIQEFIARNKHYTFPIAWRFHKSEDDNLPTIRATPTTIFVGKDGQIAQVRQGRISPEELQGIVKSLL
jgi:thiol-disulfide isomerase/thioredoxin